MDLDLFVENLVKDSDHGSTTAAFYSS